MAKHSSRILELARTGAEHRYRELKAEIASLMQAFPHLRYTKGSRGRAGSGAGDDGPRRRKSHMSPAARKAASARMKKYWAERRKAKAKQ